ncbi:hypothetical protein SAMN05660653_01435 [Desulfonatronum thiosulfatophilum]|uniref:Uncharacterized protein n=1 Tax=Desulfonatronum thiosulfatophilum TaxID=617002 RepID=A0A1G6CA67_9BACT|nr:hypothetical protein SAMN05660653_01435 [Desulfonatronum thiosulfatophilum]
MQLKVLNDIKNFQNNLSEADKTYNMNRRLLRPRFSFAMNLSGRFTSFPSEFRSGPGDGRMRDTSGARRLHRRRNRNCGSAR